MIRLSKALQQETLKRLPWIFLLFAILLLGQGVYNSRLARENTQTTKQIVTSQKQLLERQQKALDGQGRIIRNLAVAVQDLKEDNARQTDYIQCLLTAQGLPDGNNKECVKPNNQTSTTTVERTTTTNTTTTRTTNGKSTITKPKPTPQPVKKNFLQRLLDGVFSIL